MLGKRGVVPSRHRTGHRCSGRVFSKAKLQPDGCVSLPSKSSFLELPCGLSLATATRQVTMSGPLPPPERSTKLTLNPTAAVSHVRKATRSNHQNRFLFCHRLADRLRCRLDTDSDNPVSSAGSDIELEIIEHGPTRVASGSLIVGLRLQCTSCAGREPLGVRSWAGRITYRCERKVQ